MQLQEKIQLTDVNDQDLVFLRDLYFDVRMPELTQSGLNSQAREHFLTHQFQMQQNSFQNEFPNGEHKIIHYANERIGRFYFNENSTSIYLVDISIITGYRNKGIGSFLIKQVMDKGRKSILPVTLSVEKQNTQAYSLYKRLGFKFFMEDGIRDILHWSAK